MRFIDILPNRNIVSRHTPHNLERKFGRRSYIAVLMRLFFGGGLALGRFFGRAYINHLKTCHQRFGKLGIDHGKQLLPVSFRFEDNTLVEIRHLLVKFGIDGVADARFHFLDFRQIALFLIGKRYLDQGFILYLAILDLLNLKRLTDIGINGGPFLVGRCFLLDLITICIGGEFIVTRSRT